MRGPERMRHTCDRSGQLHGALSARAAELPMHCALRLQFPAGWFLCAGLRACTAIPGAPLGNTPLACTATPSFIPAPPPWQARQAIHLWIH